MKVGTELRVWPSSALHAKCSCFLHCSESAADRGQFAYMMLELRAFAYIELALRCSRKSYGGITDNPVKLACRRVQDAVHTVECSKESKLKQQDSENKVPWAIEAWKTVDLSV